ncbi:MAG: ABC transporter ATP-binding protein [Clostridia bacterium]
MPCSGPDSCRSGSSCSLASRCERGTFLAEPIIELVSVTKRYGARTALNDVTWTAMAGHVHGVIGANGSGKTTLLKVLAGLVTFAKGRAKVADVELTPGRHRVPPGIGIALEGVSLLPQFTGRENLRLLASLRGTVDDEWIDTLLTSVGLDPRDRRRAGAYSSGMRQRLNLAQAMLDRPILLLLDEPTNGLDPEGAGTLLEMMAHSSGRTVVMASHRLDEVARVCDVVWSMREGVLSSANTPPASDEANHQ